MTSSSTTFSSALVPTVSGLNALISVTHDNGGVILKNTLQDSLGNAIGIQVEESTGVIVANNVIVLTGTGNEGIEVDNVEFAAGVSITNNRIETASLGMGIVTNTTGSNAMSVLIQGNDLIFNLVGVYVNGPGTIDAGGGPLGSLGGNDFHEYVSTAGGSAAISMVGGTINAGTNIFSGSGPGAVVVGGGIDGGPAQPRPEFRASALQRHARPHWFPGRDQWLGEPDTHARPSAGGQHDYSLAGGVPAPGGWALRYAPWAARAASRRKRSGSTCC